MCYSTATRLTTVCLFLDRNEESIDLISRDNSPPSPPPPIRRRPKRTVTEYRNRDGSDSGVSSSASDDAGFGVMRVEIDDDDSMAELRARRQRRDEDGAVRLYTNMTQSEVDQARLVSSMHPPGAAPALSLPQPPGGGGSSCAPPSLAALVHGGAAVAPPYRACPVCSERFESLHNESRARSAGDRSDKARTALQQTIVDRYALIFSIETTLRIYLNDDQLLPLLLQLHQRMIERPAREHGIGFQAWTLHDLQTHFNRYNPHIFDPVREVRVAQALVREAMFAVHPHLIQPDPNMPGQTEVNRSAVTALSNLMTQNAKLVTTISKMQTSCGAESASSAIFSLVSTIQRLGGNSSGVDEAVLHNPILAAGTMVTGGTATQGTQTSKNVVDTAGATMYNISGY